MKLTYISDFSLALESLFGPDFDLVTSARFLPTSVLGKKKELCKLNVHQEELWTLSRWSCLSTFCWGDLKEPAHFSKRAGQSRCCGLFVNLGRNSILRQKSL